MDLFSEKLRNEDIRKLVREMKGYLRRLRYLFVKFDFPLGSRVSIVLLLKSIKHNFVGLISLKLSLRKVFRLQFEDLYGFDRLFAWLRPTLKHLDLAFAENHKPDINFPEILGGIILKNLHKLQSLTLNFRKTPFPMSLVKFFINTACPQMTNLRSLSLQMENCFLYDEWNSTQANTLSNLQCLKLDFDRCFDVGPGYLATLQSDIFGACPVLEELYIRLPNNKRFSGGYLSAMKEEFLQRLNLKRIAVELSHELEETWDRYQDVLAIERAEEMRIEESAWRIKQKAGGEEGYRLYYETLIEDEDPPQGLDQQDLATDELECEKLQEMEAQDEAERVIHGEVTEHEWEILHETEEQGWEIGHEMEDWNQ